MPSDTSEFESLVRVLEQHGFSEDENPGEGLIQDWYETRKQGGDLSSWLEEMDKMAEENGLSFNQWLREYDQNRQQEPQHEQVMQEMDKEFGFGAYHDPNAVVEGSGKTTGEQQMARQWEWVAKGGEAAPIEYLSDKDSFGSAAIGGFPGDGPPPLKPTGGDTSLYDQWAKAANAGKSAEFWKSGNRAPQSLEDKQGDGMQGSEAYLPAGRWSGEPARMPKLNPQQIATDQYNMRYELSPEAFRSLGKVPSDHNFAPSGNVGYRNVMRSLIQDAAKAKAQMPAQWRGPQSLEEEVLQQKAFPDAPELENYDPYVTPQKGEYELDPSELEEIQGYGHDPRKPKSSPYGR